MTLDDFWRNIAERALAVVNASQPYPDLGFPQPGWVGPAYRPTQGVVIVMQNPGVAGLEDLTNEKRFQEALRIFQQEPSVENYRAYSDEAMRQMVGWTRFDRFVEPLLDGAKLSPKEIAWINAVKYRTQGNAVTWTASQFREQISQFLYAELAVLKPAAIVTHGSWADYAIGQWQRSRAEGSANVIRERIPQRGTGSGRDDIRTVGKRLGAVMSARGLM